MLFQTNENLKVDLVIEMESITCNIHPILSEVVMEAALTAIDVLLNKVCYASSICTSVFTKSYNFH